MKEMAFENVANSNYTPSISPAQDMKCVRVVSKTHHGYETIGHSFECKRGSLVGEKRITEPRVRQAVQVVIYPSDSDDNGCLFASDGFDRDDGVLAKWFLNLRGLHWRVCRNR
jgi:hypothetical protein